jgi:hypothetical protein
MKAVTAALAITLAACATPALADDVSRDLACKLHHAVSDVNSFEALPPAIVSFVRAKMGAGNLPNSEIMAPHGGDFNATDVITKPAPGRRFIRGGHTGNVWFFWFEHGGIAYSRNIAVFELPVGGAPKLIAHIGYFTENPCALTDAVLDHRMLPQSQQSGWW